MSAWADLEAARREREREARVVDFAMAGVLHGIAGSMGKGIPDDEAIRELVRAGRILYAEWDHPTVPGEAPKPDEFGRPEEPADLVDELFGAGR